MILERLAVRAFGCFRERVEFEFDERFNIVAGKNEAGKSTLFWALHHALFTPYGSKADEVRRLVPWGTDLSPEVAVEFRVGAERFRLTKRFLNQAGCTLAEWDGARFRDLADGDKAEERVRAHLLAERPGSGAAQSRHRGLARLLWVPQGETALPEIDGDLRRRIEQSLEALTLDEGEGRLLAAILKRYAGIWTKSGKGFIKDSGLPALEDELDALKARRAELAVSLAEADKARQKLQSLGTDLAELDDQIRLRAKAVEALEVEAKRIGALKAEFYKERAELEKAKARLEQLSQEWERLKALKADAKAAAKELAEEIAPKLEEAAKHFEIAKSAREQARISLVDAERAMKTARDAWQKARRLHEARDAAAVAGEAAGLIAEVEELYAKRDELGERLLRMASPAEADVDRARSLESRLQQIEAKLEAVGLRASFAAEREWVVHIQKDGGEAAAFRAHPSRRLEARAGRRLEWRIEGVGVFSVESGAEEAVSLEREREKTALELRELLAPFGAGSAEELARLLEERREVEREKASLEAEARRLLRGAGALDDLKARKAELDRKVEAICRELAIERSALEAGEPPHVEAAWEAYNAAEALYAARQRALDAAAAQVEKAQRLVTELEKARAVAEQKREKAEKDIARLLEPHGSEEELAREHTAAREAHRACEERVRLLAMKLPRDEDDPERRLETERRALRELEKERQNLEIAMAQLRQQVEDAVGSGGYEALARLEESLRIKEDEYERLVRRAKAIKLLKALGEARQKQLLDQLTEPISSRVTRYFEKVTGESRRIHFDEALKPAKMDTSRAIGVSIEALSTGAREQLYVLSRLALGRFLASKNGRMLFVLDDSLVNTDAFRRRRFLDLLFEAAEELQIVLLTCHAEWYRGLEGVRKLSLDSVEGSGALLALS